MAKKAPHPLVGREAEGTLQRGVGLATATGAAQQVRQRHPIRLVLAHGSGGQGGQALQAGVQRAGFGQGHGVADLRADAALVRFQCGVQIGYLRPRRGAAEKALAMR